MKIIDNFISNEEATIIKDYIFANETRVKNMGPDTYDGTCHNSLTGRWYLYNWLTSKTCGSILIPKLTKELPNLYIRLWANIFRRGEGIKLHNHGTVKLSGNLYIGGPEDSATHYAGRKPVHNKIGTLTIFDAQLDHWVEINKTGIPRVSMAFDVRDSMPNRANELSPHTFIPLGTHVN